MTGALFLLRPAIAAQAARSFSDPITQSFGCASTRVTKAFRFFRRWAGSFRLYTVGLIVRSSIGPRHFRQAFSVSHKGAHLLHCRDTRQLFEVAEEARCGRTPSDTLPFAKAAGLEFTIADDGRFMRREMAPPSANGTWFFDCGSLHGKGPRRDRCRQLPWPMGGRHNWWSAHAFCSSTGYGLIATTLPSFIT